MEVVCDHLRLDSQHVEVQHQVGEKGMNIVEALAEARRRGLLTIALVGYDGGCVAAEDLADHVIVSRSQNIPRIQEAQASAYHVLCELIS